MSDIKALLELQTLTGISIADLEEILLSRNDPTTTDLLEPGVNYGGTAYDTYRRYGSFLTQDDISEYLNGVLSEVYRLMGRGPSGNSIQNFLSRLDRYGNAIVPMNTMNYGYTFITRPRLNMTRANLVQNAVLNTLDTMEPNSVAFMIRSLLDTRLTRGEELFRGAMISGGGSSITREVMDFTEAVRMSGLVDPNNPFFIPLCNGLKGMSGFPDFTIETETTEGDFHSSDFTFAKGSDMMNRSQEFSLEFRDTNGSIVLSCIYFWLIMIALQCKGTAQAYPDDIYEQRLNYTVSIYRFITDPSRRYILWWAKATGCFPKSAPVGALFNINQGEVTISSAGNFSIPFAVNKVEVNDPGILLDFNMLMERYCPAIKHMESVDAGRIRADVGMNYIGLPYINASNTDEFSGMVLDWRTSPMYLSSAGIDSISDGSVDNSARLSELAQRVEDKRAAKIKELLESMRSSTTSSSDELESGFI